MRIWGFWRNLWNSTGIYIFSTEANFTEATLQSDDQNSHQEDDDHSDKEIDDPVQAELVKPLFDRKRAPKRNALEKSLVTLKKKLKSV